MEYSYHCYDHCHMCSGGACPECNPTLAECIFGEGGTSEGVSDESLGQSRQEEEYNQEEEEHDDDREDIVPWWRVKNLPTYLSQEDQGGYGVADFDMSVVKASNVPSWHNQTNEKKILRRSCRLTLADVYPQDPKQDEDNLGHEKLKKGYTGGQCSYEYESLHSSRMNDRLDDIHHRAAQYFIQIMQKKNDINGHLDKTRKAAQGVTHLPSPTLMKSKDRAAWFMNLTKGKGYLSQISKAPVFKSREDMFEYLFDFRVTPARALWYLKLAANIGQNHKKNKTFSGEIFTVEYAHAVSSIIRESFILMYTKDIEEDEEQWDRFIYFTRLARAAFDEGVIDRQEFINELCDLFTDIFVRRRHKHYDTLEQLEHWLLNFSYYFPSAIQNLVLARRVAVMFSMKLSLFYEEEKLKLFADEDEEGKKLHTKEEVEGMNIIEKLFACEEKKPLLNVIISYIFACAAEQPGSLIYNKHFVGYGRLPHMLTQLGGSPLDYLPCRLTELPLDVEKETMEAMKEKIEEIEEEVIIRSEEVQSHWSLQYNSMKKQALLVEGCLNIVGILDYHDPLMPNVAQSAFEEIFNGLNRHRYQYEIVARIRLCITWAVTVQREGPFRGWLISKIFKQLIDHRPFDEAKRVFGGFDLLEIFIDYIYDELPPSTDPTYTKVFGNLMTFFHDLFRNRVFDYSELLEIYKDYTETLVRQGDLSYLRPLMTRFPVLIDEPKKKRTTSRLDCPVINRQDEMPQEVRPSTPVTTNENPNIPFETPPPALQLASDAVEPAEHEEPETTSEKEKQKTVAFITVPDEAEENHRLMHEEMSMFERFIIQLPMKGSYITEELEKERRQLMYGTSCLQDVYQGSARRVASEFLRIFKRKMYVRWCKKSDDVKFTRRTTPQQLKDLMRQFKMNTYIDQQLVSDLVSDGFVNHVKAFIKGETLQIPTFESLDIACSLFMQSKDYNGYFAFVRDMAPLLRPIERVIRSFSSVIIPGLFISQYAYVLLSYVVKNLHYFVRYEHAAALVNKMYSALEKMLKADLHARNGFLRGAAAAVFHLRGQLKKSQVVEGERLLGGTREFLFIFENGTQASKGNVQYNKYFMKDAFEYTGLRIYMYHDFKKRLPSFMDPVNRYSFVVNAFITASKYGRDYDRLTELANFCSHFTAHFTELADDWMGAIRALCSSKANHGFTHLLDKVDVSDCSNHYALSTFAVLLATKYCFSIPKMISELINGVFPTIMKNNGRSRSAGYKMDYETEPNVCLALLFLAQMNCSSDDPFILSEHYRGTEPVKRLLDGENADMNILSQIHWFEMDKVYFPMIANIGILHDKLQSRVRDHDLKLEVVSSETPITKREYRKEFLPLIVRQVLISISEQEWATDRMFKLASSNGMGAFNDERLKQNCLGQQLLRLGTRRRCERDILAELSVCNANSKKALIDKLFAVLNIWNLRATIYDLKLMIKEISPESSNKHAQQGAIAADALMVEIGKCCKELFVQAYKQGKEIYDFEDDPSKIDFSKLTNYLLIPTLVKLCPVPSNVPSSFTTTSFNAKFLHEAWNVLDVGSEPHPERLKMSAWLMQEKSFLNIILACLRDDDNQDKTARETFMSAILKQIQDLTKLKESPVHHYNCWNDEERMGVFHRLKFIGIIFNNVCMQNIAEPWAVLLFQLMLHGVISPTRNMKMYQMVFDMLNCIVTWSLTDPSTSVVVSTSTEKAGTDAKYRFPTYMAIVKKLRKELHDIRTPMEMRNLHAFLPLPKNNMEFLALETYGTPQSNQLKSMRQLQQQLIGTRRGRICYQIKKNSERTKITTFEMLPGYNPDSFRKMPNLTWYQMSRIDVNQPLVQRWMTRMIPHKHQFAFVRANYLMLEQSEAQDFFLYPPVMDTVGEPPVIDDKKGEEEEEEKKEKEAAEAKEDEKKEDEEKKDIKKEEIVLDDDDEKKEQKDDGDKDKDKEENEKDKEKKDGGKEGEEKKAKDEGDSDDSDKENEENKIDISETLYDPDDSVSEPESEEEYDSDDEEQRAAKIERNNMLYAARGIAPSNESSPEEEEDDEDDEEDFIDEEEVEDDEVGDENDDCEEGENDDGRMDVDGTDPPSPSTFTPASTSSAVIPSPASTGVNVKEEHASDDTRQGTMKTEIIDDKLIKEEDIVVLDSPVRSSSSGLPFHTPPTAMTMTPPKMMRTMTDPSMKPEMGQPLHATTMQSQMMQPAPAPITKGRRKSSTSKDGTEKKERKRPVKRNVAGQQVPPSGSSQPNQPMPGLPGQQLLSPPKPSINSLPTNAPTDPSQRLAWAQQHQQEQARGVLAAHSREQMKTMQAAQVQAQAQAQARAKAESLGHPDPMAQSRGQGDGHAHPSLHNALSSSSQPPMSSLHPAPLPGEPHDAKSKLHDLLSKRQEHKTHHQPQSLMNSLNQSNEYFNMGTNPPLPSSLKRPEQQQQAIAMAQMQASQQQQRDQREVQIPPQSQPAGPNMGQLNLQRPMNEQQKHHQLTNQALANHVHAQQSMKQAAALQQQQQSGGRDPGPSLRPSQASENVLARIKQQQASDMQYSGYPQGQPNPNVQQRASPHPGEYAMQQRMAAAQQQQAAQRMANPSNPDPSSQQQPDPRQLEMQRAQQRSAYPPGYSQSFGQPPSQTNNGPPNPSLSNPPWMSQPSSSTDPASAASSYGPPPAKMQAMASSSGLPFAPRPGAPANNQSTNVGQPTQPYGYPSQQMPGSSMPMNSQAMMQQTTRIGGPQPSKVPQQPPSMNPAAAQRNMNMGSSSGMSVSQQPQQPLPGGQPMQRIPSQGSMGKSSMNAYQQQQPQNPSMLMGQPQPQLSSQQMNPHMSMQQQQQQQANQFNAARYNNYPPQ